MTSWKRHQRVRRETAVSLAEAERDEPHFECRKVQILQDSDGLFMGLVLSSNGVEPSENKVKAIRELKQPRGRRQQKPDKFAYLTMENSIFARFAREFFSF